MNDKDDCLQSAKRLAEAYDITREGLWEWIIANNFIHHNDRWKEIFGYALHESAELLSDFQARVHPDDIARVWHTVAAAQQTGELFEQQYRIILPSGEVKHIRDRGRVADWDAEGKATRMIGSVADMTEEASLQSHLNLIASYDALTGLPSRHSVRDSFKQMKKLADARKSYIVFLFLDLDDFRLINDTQGHEVGDQLLQLLSQRLQQHRPHQAIISRHGGDEFLFLLPIDTDSMDDINQIAIDIISLITQPFYLNNLQLKIGASLGASIYPDDGDNFNTLLRHSDTAMYAAKHAGRNQFRLFLPILEELALSKLNMTNQLHQALDKHQLFLVYQPQVNLHSGNWDSAEVLIRWRDNDGQLVSPIDFIPLAEETGHIIAITDWIIETAVETLARWRRGGIQINNLSINIPACVLSETDFLSKLIATVYSYGLDTKSIELEITESQLLNSNRLVSDTLNAITQAGFNLSIDDFGTGYSNISQIKKMKVHKLKIDKSFIDEITQSKEGALLVRAVIDMARALNIKIVAEGVELDSQLAYLSNYGCDYVQGYLFAKPLSETEFIERYLSSF